VGKKKRAKRKVQWNYRGHRDKSQGEARRGVAIRESKGSRLGSAGIRLIGSA
jgi:hypothetical protein